MSVSAAELDMFTNINAQDAQNAQNAGLAKQDTEKKVKYGNYNSNIKANLTVGTKLNINLPDSSVVVTIKAITKKSKDRFSYTASSDKGTDTVHIAQYKQDIMGSINVDGELYKFTVDKKGRVTIKKVNQDLLIDHDENYTEDVSQDFLDRMKNGDAKLVEGGASEYTVIVAYTAGFAGEFSNNGNRIQAYMDLLEEETNASYDRSGVNASVKIVHHYKTTYAQTGDARSDINSFKNTRNVATRVLRRLRNRHNADIMILLTGNRGYRGCGRAAAIGANESNAFAVAKESCATGNYTFGHEVGHLFGARHIITRDSSTRPFAYGHGYCSTGTGRWRTVMAYGCPRGTGGSRIQQWSNPNIKIGNEATGTRNVEYNAKVLNVRIGEVVAFRAGAVVYENAENGNTAGWRVYDKSPRGASIRNVYDRAKRSKVIKLRGSGTSNGFILGGYFQNSASWNDSSNKTIKWSMKYSEDYIVYVSVHTSKGHRYLTYKPGSSSYMSGQYIHYGLGAATKNGRWKNITRNLEADLKNFESTNRILKVEGFLVRGSGFVDDIKLQ